MVFSADHGAQWPLAKCHLYDAGIRIYDAGIRTPLIVSWPGRIAPGRTAAMTSWIDLLPTLVELAGGTHPENIDGLSFLPVLFNPAARHRSAIFASHVNDNGKNVYPMRAVRTLRWKYIRNLRPDAAFTTHIDLVAGKLGQRAFFSEWEAAAAVDPAAAALLHRYHERPAEESYDLQADPREQHNLAPDAACLSQLQTLLQELDHWLTATGDQLQLSVAPRLLKNPAEWGPAAAQQ